MNNKTIDYKYLTNELQFPEATAKAIIRQAKIKNGKIDMLYITIKD